MPRHIELDRTFWPLGDGEEYDPDTLRAQARFGLHLMHWSNLLTMTRVVILAEAGTGKTHELRETARRLRREGKAAFFCRIEWLATDSLENALSEGNVEEVRSWLEGSHTAWFFLDSVDEARLTNPQFSKRLCALWRRHSATQYPAHTSSSPRGSVIGGRRLILCLSRTCSPHLPHATQLTRNGQSRTSLR